MKELFADSEPEPKEDSVGGEDAPDAPAENLDGSSCGEDVKELFADSEDEAGVEPDQPVPEPKEDSVGVGAEKDENLEGSSCGEDVKELFADSSDEGGV